ncbi:MAG TPA: polysaccharide biosynthesis tyrosine autokinase [Jatrophihabitantaceae bacterium]|nr:polysaccharide biosynthesis tyrosine autokinase [Jatrophihabitantaceae bacterium]
MTLRSYLRVLRERWKLVVSFILAATAIAVVITALTPKSYEATAQVLVASAGSTDPSIQSQSQLYVQNQVATFAQVVGSPDVLKSVKRDLALQISDTDLKSKLSASAATGESIVLVHAKDGNAGQAAAIANSAAAGLAKAVEGYTVTPNGNSVNLFVTGPATAPSKPASPNVILNVALGVILGLLVGAALAVARDILDTRIKDADTLAKVSLAPTMGVVVEDPKTQRHPIATRAGTRNMRAENYRQLRANLQFANVDEHPRVIAVTSSIPGEGKTTVAINLASTLAEAGFTVCLVDADLRRPTIAKVLGLLSPVGLTSVLIHQIDLSEAMQSAGSNFYVLTSGPTPPNPSEVLASSYVRDVVRSLLDKVDYVVLDTAPLLPVADGSEVAALADGTLLVARHGMTTDSHIRRSVHALARVDAKLLGVLLNRIPARKSSEYGYTYYRAENEVPTHANQGRPAGRGRRAK